MSLVNLEDFTKENIIADKTGVEGGYVNNPDDRGGETNHGVTKTLALQHISKLRNLFNWDGDMRNFTQQMAFWVYDYVFWRPLFLDDVIQRHPLIADKLFDVGINAGGVVSISHLQTILNVNNKQQSLYPDIQVDGNMGPGTLAALDAYIANRGLEGIKRLLVLLLAMQGAFYVKISVGRERNETFTYGWAGRVSRDIGVYDRILGF